MSIYVPKPKKTPAGSWTVRVRVGGGDESVTRATKKECEEAALRIKLEGGRREKATLSKLIDRYIDKRSNILSPATVRGYRVIQNSRFKSIMNSPVRPGMDLQAIINEEAKLCSAKTLSNAYRLLRSVLKDAGIEVKPAALPQIVRNERPFLDPDQIKIFLTEVKDDPCEVEALLALHSLRRSEIIAIEAEDIRGGFIIVNKSAVMDEHGVFIYKQTNKNKASNRVLPVMIPRLETLVEGRTGHLVAGNPNSMNARINRVCKRAELPLVGVHGLRHSFASLAAYTGLSKLETKRIGGWSDDKTMDNIYTHIYEKSLQAKINAMSAFYAAGDDE